MPQAARHLSPARLAAILASSSIFHRTSGKGSAARARAVASVRLRLSPEVHLMRPYFLLAAALLLSAGLPAYATVFANLRGVVHDPQHRPIAGAKVTLQSANSAFVLHATTDANGAFALLIWLRSACTGSPPAPRDSKPST